MADPARPPIPDLTTAAARSNVRLAPVIAVVGLLTSVVVVRALEPEDLVVYLVAIAVRGALQFVGDLGTGAASTRILAELQARGARGQALRLVRRLALIRLLMVGVIIIAAVAFPDRLVDLLGLRASERDLLVLFVAIGAAELGSTLGYYVLSGTLRHAWANRALLVVGLVQPAAVITAAALGLGVEGILAGVALGSLLRLVLFSAEGLRAVLRFERHGAALEGVAKSYLRVTSASLTAKTAAFVHSRQIVTLIAVSTVSRPQLAVFGLAYDFTHQILTALSGPVYSLLLPTFAARRDHDGRKRALDTSTRVLAVTILPVAAVLAGLFGALAPTVFGARYEAAATFAVIFVIGYAVEIVLSGPVTALLLSSDVTVPSYRTVKLISLLPGTAYFVLVDHSLVAVALAMMATRVLSAVALHVVASRRLGMRVAASWLPPLSAVLVAVGVVAALAAALLEPVPAVIVGTLGAAGAGALAARRFRLLGPEDLQRADRVLPVARRFISPLVRLEPVSE